MRRLTMFLVLALSACATSARPVTDSGAAVQGSYGGHADSAPQLVPIPGARMPLPGIVTGGVPSEENLRQAKQLGYRSVLSLLPPEDNKSEALVTQLGMYFISIPIAGAEDLTEENALKLGDVLSAPQSWPLIMHCQSGNRSGALLALHAFYVEGATVDEALELGDAAGLTKLRNAVEAHMRTALRAQAERLRAEAD